ncbi:MAG TPA: glycoside hydrolase family 15 protein [Candidatus Saccharimonadales bacterium]|nr:glycoside hydrolase family 15 protein [Candidatus Saccharimonadales bacterium]
MPRPLILSNGSMAVGINNFGLVHDFYYPYVGLENHATSKVLRHRIGVWVDGDFSWLDDGSWVFEHVYEKDTLIGNSSAAHAHLGVRLEFRDCVDVDMNVLLREITVVNEHDQARQIRLMMHQVFQISNSRNGDTAQYLPDQNAILSYKGRRMFIMRAEHENGSPFDQFSIGIWGIEGREGTYKDAEDGELSGNPVEHGNVDSVVRLKLELEPQASGKVRYWIAAGTSTADALRTSDAVKEKGFSDRFASTARHWQEWLVPATRVAERLEDRTSADRFLQSVLLIKAHMDRRGAVIASLDTQMLHYARDAYAYCWPRDAAFALWPLIRMGYHDEAKAFFDFCRTGLHEDGYLMHKYQADRALGSSWHPYFANGKPELPIQEDETAMVLFLIGQYQQLSGDDEYVRGLYSTLIRPMADFMATYIDHDTKLPHASYDLWEQKFLTHTFTVGAVYAALTAAVRLAELYDFPDDAIRWQAVADDIQETAGHTLYNDTTKFFHKGFLKTAGGLQFDETIDVSSFYGAFMFGLFDMDDPRIVVACQSMLKAFNQDGDFSGLPRYVHDGYNAVDPTGLGNPWFVTSLWLAQYYLERDEHQKSKAIVTWTEAHMLPSGVLSEQINPFNGHSVSVAPLVWSQAEYLSTQLDTVTHPPVPVASGAEASPTKEAS